MGFELVEYGGFSLSSALGMRLELRELRVDARALPGKGGDDLLLERSGLGLELSLLAEYYLARSLFHGFLVGTRIGGARGLIESDFDSDSPVGNPETLSRGAFVSVYLGLASGAW